MPYIVLVGMMGSGKSTVGRALAESIGVPFSDTDSMLERRIGRRIPQLFDMFGEATFRDHETAVLQNIEETDGVLATGGGIVLREQNWVEIRRLGVVLYLDVSAEILAERLERSNRKRPLLASEDWKDKLKKMLADRRPLYQRADFTVEVGDEPISQVVGRIREAMGL